MTDRFVYQGDGDERELVFNRLGHDDAERVLEGRVPDEGVLAVLAAIVADIRESSIESIPPRVAQAQVAAAAAAARVAEAVPATPGRERAGFLRSATARALIGTAAGLALILGAGAAGLLPDPIQSVVANAAEVVGISLPRPQPTLPGPETATTTTAAAVTTTSPAATPVTDPEPTTTIPDDDDADDDADDGNGGGPLAGLVGTHDWGATGCGGETLEVRYRVTAAGTLELVSVSEPDAEVDAAANRILVEFSSGDSVRIDLDRHGDDWEIDERHDTDCDDSDDDDSDDDDSDDGDDGDGDDADDGNDDADDDDADDDDGNGDGQEDDDPDDDDDDEDDDHGGE